MEFRHGLAISAEASAAEDMSATVHIAQECDGVHASNLLCGADKVIPQAAASPGITLEAALSDLEQMTDIGCDVCRQLAREKV